MKLFEEVFPTLRLKGEMKALFERVQVERISAPKDRKFLRIYLGSEHLIEKDKIWALEREIKNQLFPYANTTIKIYERFHLSSLYTPEKLMEAYQKSMMQELRELSPLEYSLFKNAEVSYPDEKNIKMVLEESVLAREKEKELVRILEKIFQERCGFDVKIETAYREKKERKHKAEQEQKIENKIAEIVSMTRGNGDAESAFGEEGRTPALKEAGGATSSREPAGGMPGERGGRNRMPGGAGKKFDKDAPRPLKRSENPDVIFGRDFDGEDIPIENITDEIGEVIIRGKVLNYDEREITKIEKTILIFTITDLTDTIGVKIFVKTEQVGEIKGALQKGNFLKIRGVAMMDKFDHELGISSVSGIRKIPDFTVRRMDNSMSKRVELHCHTKMSEMDGVSEVKDIVKRAYQWGMPAVAITDHGVLQSFPDANHVWEDLWRAEKEKRKAAGEAEPDKFDFFKVIYGVEGYLVDDLNPLVTGDKGQILSDETVVFDIETTGFSPVNDRIIEIGAVKVREGKITERFSAFVNPGKPIPFRIEQLTGINDAMVLDAPGIEEVLPRFLDFCGDAVLAAHNAGFDMSFIKENVRRAGILKEFTYLDTMGIARLLLPGQAKHTLDAVAKTLHISLENHHRAVDDAECTAEMYQAFLKMLAERGIKSLAQLEEAGCSNPEIIKKMTTYHVIILAKNNVGRTNLYTLVSKSHLDYFSRRPRIPKSELIKYREGLIIGSACEAGELYKALLDGREEAELARINSAGANGCVLVDQIADNMRSPAGDSGLALRRNPGKFI